SVAESINQFQNSPDHHSLQTVSTQLEESAAGRERTTHAAEGPSLEEQVRRAFDSELKERDSRAARGASAHNERTRVVEPRLAPAPQVSAQTSRPAVEGGAQATDATPTIHVTIGRVHVRAVISEASKESRRAPSRPRPMLSLEDYLGRRGG